MRDWTSATVPDIATAIERVLAQRGHLTGEQLQAAVAATVDLGNDPSETLDQVLVSGAAPLVFPLVDDRFALLSTLLTDRVFTHRLHQVEVEHDVLALAPDLAAVWALTGDQTYSRLPDGAPLNDLVPAVDDELLTERGVPYDRIDSTKVAVLPPGRLRELGVGSGDLIGARAAAAGMELLRIDPETVADPHVAGQQLSNAFAAHDHDHPLQLEPVVWTACADSPDLFTEPLPPLAELLELAGLARDGVLVAPQGFDFGTYEVEGRIDSIKQVHAVDDDEALAVLVLTRLYEQAADLLQTLAADSESGNPEEIVSAALATLDQAGPDREPNPTDADSADADSAASADSPDSADSDASLVDNTLRFLSDPAVARAVLTETVDFRSGGAAALGLFAESLEAKAPQEARAALRWLRAKAHERLGDVDEAERILQTAESIDPHWSPMLTDLARYASDRGDAERGLALLHRADTPEGDELAQLLNRFRSQPRTDLGRNDRCWCGSGRKYKVCHLRREHPSLAERADWLYGKSRSYLTEGHWRAELIGAAEERARHWEDDDALLQALEDPLVVDAVLFEGGGFAEFLRYRGALLPDDEQSLAQQWLHAHRSVYDVEDVFPGKGFTARDVRTGVRHDVHERLGSQHLAPGALICARIVPDGDTMQVYGGIVPISATERDDVLALLDEDPDPLALIAFLS